MNSVKTIDAWGRTVFINKKGYYHREDGPAMIFEDNDCWYYLNGLKYSKEDWELEVIKIKLERLKYL